MNGTLLLLLALTATPAVGPLPEFTRILLPLVTRTPIPGAHGSLWETVVTVHNASDEATFLFPPDCPRTIPDRFCLLGVGTQLAAGTTARVDLLLSRPMAPVFVNVTKSLADRIFVQLRVHDLSRQSESFGTELPVIRASEMKTTPGEILDIPISSRFRLTFRLYADQVAVDSVLRVRFVNPDSGSSRELQFTVKPRSSAIPPGEPITTADLYEEISDISSYAELQGAEAVRIEIIPQTAGVRYWAFVSVTNNETQHVTTLTVH
ncbi:MAG TPA: hypothetical protein VF701_04880 [Thermoanaerobaculia bacterium]